MNWKKTILLAIVAIVVILQLIPSGRPDTSVNNPDDLLLNNEVPDSIAAVFRDACYDCHSNQSVFPWYAYVAPVSWLVNRDIRVGRENLNFSLWESNNRMDKAKLLGDIAEEVSDGNMPMPIYVLMHPEAKLSAAQRQMIADWSDEFAERLFE